MDEAALSSAIFESLRKCIQLREKYTSIGLQRKKDNPRDYPNLSNIPISWQSSTAHQVLKCLNVAIKYILFLVSICAT